MQYDAWSSATEKFRSLAFSEIVRRAVERARTSDVDIRCGSLLEVERLTQAARQKMDLASDDIIAAIHAKKPQTLRILEHRSSGKQIGLFAYLPLNDLGVAAMINGEFDGTRPDPNWVCDAKEEPEAVYIWLAWMPGGLARSLGAIAMGFQAVAHGDCPVFSRAANSTSSHLHQTMGFLDGRQFYPTCKEGLLVAFPQRPIAKPRERQEVRVARTMEDIMQVMSIRSATYIAEQFCLYEEEFDGNDFCSTHFLGLIDGDAAGCIRVRFFADFAKIERLAVRAEYRNSRLSFELVKAAIRLCEKKGYARLYGHSRFDLVRFWRVFGFKERDDRPAFSFANVRYVEMVRDTARTEDAITLNSPPMTLIRPEGEWDRPGPLDRSRSESDPRRIKFLKERMKTVANIEAAK